MNTRQMKTIGRLVEMKRRNAEKAELAHAVAHTKTVEAERARIEADRRWLAALDAAEDIGDAVDLEYRDMHIRALRRAIDHAEREYTLARVAEAASREAMTDARIELRRFETWIERSQEEQNAEARRVARIAEDEVAARKLRVG